MKNDNLIRSQICTCHDSRAVVTCAKLWPEQIIIVCGRATHILKRFGLWAHEYLCNDSVVIWLHCSHPCGWWSISTHMCYGWWTRLLHSPSLVAVRPSVGYETWPPIGWRHPLVIGWSENRLGMSRIGKHYGFTWIVGISTGFLRALTVPRLMPLGCARRLWNSVMMNQYQPNNRTVNKAVNHWHHGPNIFSKIYTLYTP